MMKKDQLKYIILFIAFSFPCSLFADFHITYEIERSYMGYNNNYIWDIWITDSACYIKTPKSVRIFSHDFTYCTEIYRDSTFYIDTNLQQSQPVSPTKIDFTKLGYEKYRPQYDWYTIDQGIEIVKTLSCRVIKSSGDADFGEINSVYHLSSFSDSKLSKKINRLFSIILLEDNTKEALVSYIKTHPTLFPIRIHEVIKQPISDDIIYKYSLTNFQDQAVAPKDLYNVPSGFQKMN